MRDGLPSFKLDTVRGVRGFYRVGQTDAGQWWLMGPDDLPFFICAVNDVRPVVDSPHDPVARLRSWRCNALGSGAAANLLDEGLPFVRTVDFTGTAPAIRAQGINLPDVFDPSWSAAAQERAREACFPWFERTDLLGWLMDDDLGWGGGKEEGSLSLLQVCLSLEPNFAAYHSAWEFVLALHGGRIERLARAWNCPIENKGVVRELTRADRGLMTSGHLRDDARWTREFAHRYFAITSAAVRAHAPHHLILGARDLLGARGRASGHAWLAECVFPSVDIAWVNTRDLKVAPPGPVILGNFSWVPDSHAGPPTRVPTRGITSVERMLKQGRASLRASIAHPFVVGYSWDTWVDDPGEQPPFARGLVHLNDAEAREHTELLTDLNGRVSALRPFHVAIAN